MTGQRRVTDVSKDVDTQFSKIFNKCVYCSLTVHESPDFISTAQICIFAHGVTCDVEVFEELIDLHSVPEKETRFHSGSMVSLL
jgi:hypothetical protein